MATFSSFHIKTNDEDQVKRLLEELSGMKPQMPTGPLPDALTHPEGEEQPLLLAQSAPADGWISIHTNSFQKLHNWGAILSERLQTRFIQTIAQPEAQRYYFLMLENGGLVREIDLRHDRLEEAVNNGIQLPFETNLILDTPGGLQTFFDAGALELYTRAYGFGLSPLPRGAYIFLYNSLPEQAAAQPHVLQEEEEMELPEEPSSRKPWWKLWS